MSRIDDKEIQDYLDTWVGNTAVEPGMVFRALHDLKEARADLRHAIGLLIRASAGLQHYGSTIVLNEEIDVFVKRWKRNQVFKDKP
jgi:hypothetical protein